MTHRLPDVTAAKADKLALKERLNVEKVTWTNFRLMQWLLINCSEQRQADTNIQSVWCFPTKWWNLRPGALTSLFLLNGGTNIQFYILTFSFDIRNPYCSGVITTQEFPCFPKLSNCQTNVKAKATHLSSFIWLGCQRKQRGEVIMETNCLRDNQQMTFCPITMTHHDLVPESGDHVLVSTPQCQLWPMGNWGEMWRFSKQGDTPRRFMRRKKLISVQNRAHCSAQHNTKHAKFYK